jgi:hypothetical protein
MTAPAPVPAIDDRSYQELLDDALARIPVHNPEWTNFNRSDPGVTLVELFAFLTESLLYRANQIPERNRRKFLSLLGVPLAPASSARGLVTIANERGPLAATTLDAGLELAAGKVPFRTEDGLDVLPVEGRAFVKRPLANPSQQVVDYYKHLYASYQGTKPPLGDLRLYETVPLETAAPVEAAATVDGSLWIALLLREGDDVQDAAAKQARLREARQAIAGRTLSLGVVPAVDEPSATLTPTGRERPGSDARIDYQLPVGGALPDDVSQRRPRYRSLDAAASGDVLLDPGVVQLQLPDEAALGLWTNLDPLESGVGDFPPTLEDSKLDGRLLTWLRLKVSAGAGARILWTGINAARVSQRAHVAGEVLPAGTGEPDQTVQLARTPVIPDSVRLTVSAGGRTDEWLQIDDLLAAGPEVPLPEDPRAAPGAPPPPPRPTLVYALDPAAGELRFGDGARGARPPAGAILRVSYDYGAGAAGNVAAGRLATAPSLPAGMKVSNPVRTWGGAEGETVAEGEKQAARFLQHRDRLVSVADFESIVWRTPGIELGRVDVLPAYSPELAPSAPGDAPGAVTLLVVPREDPLHPDSPEPDAAFLDAICGYVDPRRLVTTEVFLRGPTYRELWVSVGIDVVAGASEAVVREQVRGELQRFLAPVDPTLPPWYEDVPVSVDTPYVHQERGWPLGKPVVALELQAVASRVAGVRYVRPVQLAEGNGSAVDQVGLQGLDLPRVVVRVASGEPASLDALRGARAPDAPPQSTVPVPVVPDTC